MENIEADFCFSASKNELEIMRRIYREHPQINIETHDNMGFRFASENGYLEVIQQLVAWKPTLNISQFEDYALRRAAENNHVEVVRQILDWRPDIKIPTNFIQYFISDPTMKDILIEHNQSQRRMKWMDITVELEEPHECPICRDLVQNAVRTPCCHLYCRRCLENWFNMDNNNCPYCRRVLVIP